MEKFPNNGKKPDKINITKENKQQTRINIKASANPQD